MNRTGLGIALAIAATVGLVFGIWPELDLELNLPLLHDLEREELPFRVPRLGRGEV